MLGRMESVDGKRSYDGVADLPDLPVFDQPQRERPRRSVDWSAVQRNFAPLLEQYRKHYDSPEKRLQGKNPEPFRIESGLTKPDQRSETAPDNSMENR